MNDEASRAMLMHLYGQIASLNNLFTTVMFASIIGLSPSKKRFIIGELKKNLSSMKEGQTMTLNSAKESNDSDNIQLSNGYLNTVEHYSKIVSKWEKQLIDSGEMPTEAPPPRGATIPQ